MPRRKADRDRSMDAAVDPREVAQMARSAFDAIEDKNMERLRTCLDRLNASDVHVPVAVQTMRDEKGRSLLEAAIAHRFEDAVDMLLELGMRAEGLTADGSRTLLDFSVSGIYGSPQICASLLKHGANPNTKTPGGFFPLYTAVSNGPISTVQMLLEAGADPNAATEGGSRAMHLAAWCKYAKAKQWCELLVHHGADIHAKSGTGLTTLYFAAQEGLVELASWLIDLGADVNVRAADGSTPLHAAARSNTNAAVCEFLISRGADVWAVTKGDKTPLQIALHDVKPRIVEVLAPHYSGCFRGTKLGMDVFAMACSEGLVEACRAAVADGVDVTSPLGREGTPLSIALCHGHVGVGAILLAAGADPDVVFRGSRPPWQHPETTALLECLHHPACVKLLLACGASPVFAPDVSTPTLLHAIVNSDKHTELVPLTFNEWPPIVACENLPHGGRFDHLEWYDRLREACRKRDDAGRTPLDMVLSAGAKLSRPCTLRQLGLLLRLSRDEAHHVPAATVDTLLRGVAEYAWDARAPVITLRRERRRT